MKKSRYDIRFSDGEDGRLIVRINDKLVEYPPLRGEVQTTVKAAQANSSLTELTDALRRHNVEWEQLPPFMDQWIDFLAENRTNEFTEAPKE